MTKPLTPANFVKRYILRHPQATIAQIQTAWNANSKMPAADLPTAQEIYNARTQLKAKFNLKTLSDIPFKNGKPDVVALGKLLVAKNKNASEKQLTLWMAYEGFDLTTDQCLEIFGKAVAPVGKVVKQVEFRPLPTELKIEKVRKAPKKSAAVYHKMESDLDQLIADATQHLDSKIVEEFRVLRRKIIVAGMELVS